jgi:hypothetical protein
MTENDRPAYAARLRCTIALALSLVSASLQAQSRVVATIPIEFSDGRAVIPVMVGSSGPFRLILDTGMPYDGILLFDTARVDLRALRNLATARVGGAGDGAASNALTDSAATFTVGSLRCENQRVTLLTDGRFRGFPNDGVIGYSVFGHYAVELDHDAARMILYEPDGFTAGAGWSSVDMVFRGNRVPWTRVYVTTAQEPAAQLAAYIDLASRENLELLERATNAFVMPATTGRRVIGRGLNGDVVAREGRVAAVALGSFVLRDVAVQVTPAAVRSRQAGADAIIGAGLLARFDVIFDYAHGKLHLRPNRSFAEPFDSEPPAPSS